eukprot:CAMPEP_0175883558 /NCGR_PEP_ID=MMETSP0107_2-20121207/44040_1 /TAXON_ID=195067 ORGANISM="Goniomonas pacifica, Strain CCMP1869" /NCGR_SAMPLE_ID=MMETSP0107_2 /ASSEMBLY_ACC=CAM_ASM_000203 /LENGTH=186 /DNA_ID=CAMNT_0017203627 /DNA_START=546 /DNA_END=1106 /DNA_ORIENTATION=+
MELLCRFEALVRRREALLRRLKVLSRRFPRTQGNLGRNCALARRFDLGPTPATLTSSFATFTSSFATLTSSLAIATSSFAIATLASATLGKESSANGETRSSIVMSCCATTAFDTKTGENAVETGENPSSPSPVAVPLADALESEPGVEVGTGVSGFDHSANSTCVDLQNKLTSLLLKPAAALSFA